MLALVGCSNVINKTLVEGTVTAKNFVPSSSYVTHIWNGKMAVPTYHTRPEEFNVTIVYQGMAFTIDSREIYTAKEVGDSIQVYKVDVYKKDGTYKRSYLQQQ